MVNERKRRFHIIMLQVSASLHWLGYRQMSRQAKTRPLVSGFSWWRRGGVEPLCEGIATYASKSVTTIEPLSQSHGRC
jgi:hypothetical protein